MGTSTFEVAKRDEGFGRFDDAGLGAPERPAPERAPEDILNRVASSRLAPQHRVGIRNGLPNPDSVKKRQLKI
jgi:hypothetical protein